MNSINSVLKSFLHLAISFLLCVSANAFAISTTEYGAYADGIHDDTSALQEALKVCSEQNKVCQIPKGKKHLVTGPLFMWGGASLKASGGGGINFTPGNNPYLLNLGISGTQNPANPTSNLKDPFTGEISNITFAILGQGDGRIIYLWRSTGAIIRDNIFNVGQSNYSATSSGNNNNWVINGDTNSIRKNVLISNNIINATAGIIGSEGIGLGEFDGATIQGNTVIGVGDDPIGVHFSRNVKILNNVLKSTHGRIYVSNSLNVEIAYNKHSRIASLADGNFYQGISLLHIDMESDGITLNSYRAPEETNIHDNVLYYPAGAIDIGAGIYIASPRGVTVERNWIVNDSTPTQLYGIYLYPKPIAWKDPTGIDPDQPRVHKANINMNANIGSNPLAVMSTGNCSEYVGPVQITNNVGTARGTDGVGKPGYSFYCLSVMTAEKNKSVLPANDVLILQ